MGNIKTPLTYDTPFYNYDGGTHKLSWIKTPQETITRQVAAAIAAHRDEKIRRALIDLGWTPPNN